MEAISLKKTTALVIAFTAAGFFLNPSEASDIDNGVKGNKGIAVSFEQLLKANDADNNGLLSKKEIAAVTDKTLLNNFNAIDINADQAISEQEFAQYLKSTK